MKRILMVLSVLAAAVTANAAVGLTGAGATFPAPLYTKWFYEYHTVNPALEINYQPIGSGGGIRQLTDRTIDFGASDAPMTDEQLTKAGQVLHIPTVLGAVVVTYNLPGITERVRLSADVIADIFLGKITQWNDAKIAALNPSVALPKDLAILVAHRSDGSGTTAVFSDYLSKANAEWKSKVGAGTALKWPVGLGGKGNDGVTGLVTQTPGAIGYIELTYAQTNKLPFASIKNKSGNFVDPSPKSVTAAANGALKTMPADFRVSITDSAAKDAYPISSFTYLLVYEKMDPAKGKALQSFLLWALNDGQKLAEPLFYAPLPKSMVGKVEQKIKAMKWE
jgi:phosphate transport system substrate-binding protein